MADTPHASRSLQFGDKLNRDGAIWELMWGSYVEVCNLDFARRRLVGFDHLRKLDYGAHAESDHLPKQENDSWRSLYADQIATRSTSSA